MATKTKAAVTTPPTTKKSTNTTKGKKKTFPKKMTVSTGTKAKCVKYCSDSRSCFHGACVITRTLGNGRIVLENGAGYVRLADIDEVEVRVISIDRDTSPEGG